MNSPTLETAADSTGGGRPQPRRFRTLLKSISILAGASALLWLGWILASAFQSSAQHDAATTPATAQPILTTVSTGKLVSETAFSGAVVPVTQVSLTLAAPAEAMRAVVTDRPIAEGDEVKDGHVLTEVNGRPVFVVKSAFAFYRDVGFGDRGPDVAAIQATLQRLGYAVEPDGSFGSDTESAVRAWYGDNGYAHAVRVRSDDEGTQPEPLANERGAQIGNGERDAAPIAEVAFVPFAELLGVKALPSSAMGALPVGAVVGGAETSDIVLGSMSTKVTFDAVPAALKDIGEGDELTIETLGAVVKGQVASVRPSSDGEAGAQEASQEVSASEDTVTVTVLPSEPLEASAAKVRLVSSRAVVDHDSLLVPTIAVADRGSGDQIVVVRRSDGTFDEVKVTVLGTLDGQAAIAPKDPRSLRDGDEVRVGKS